MKIAVFMDAYEPLHETKDPGQIPLGLQDIGTQTELITLHKGELADYKAPFPICKTEWDQLSQKTFWAADGSDAVVSYTWLGAQYMPMLQKIKASGKKAIIKIDSDGHVGWPLHPVYLRIPLSEAKSFRNFKSRVTYNIPFKFLHKRAIAAALGRIKQIELSDGVIIESPAALANLNYFLNWWGRQDLTKKTYFVPDPVTPDFMDAPLQKKTNVIISYGRWHDIPQKNTVNLVKTVASFLKMRPEYTAIIFGSGKELLEKLVSAYPKDITDRFQLPGFVEREKIRCLLAGAKMFLAPSRWESFGIAVGESLCMGCSVVGTPVESFQYLAAEGFSGTVSSDFSQKRFLSSLVADAAKWDSGFYDPDRIAAFWRPKLDRRAVAGTIAEMVNKA
ncbi:glycosyltransferase [Candidatus Bathyarchaeota archaeon]|nr:glycosyltransferase [Candidatus Bathyarchaeota archaeon]